MTELYERIKKRQIFSGNARGEVVKNIIEDSGMIIIQFESDKFLYYTLVYDQYDDIEDVEIGFNGSISREDIILYGVASDDELKQLEQEAEEEKADYYKRIEIQQEKNERKEYERLKAKFENDLE